MSIALSAYGVSLSPLQLEHIPALVEVATPAVREFFGPAMDGLEEMTEYVRDALSDPAAIPFVVESEGRIVGSTRYFRVDRTNRNAEIGHTFYAQSVWRSHVNTACKLLLLTRGFEVEEWIRIYFQTDELNVRSRRAIERLGAKQDGLIRNDRILRNGRIRTSAMYSIILSEWPGVRDRLVEELVRPRNAD